MKINYRALIEQTILIVIITFLSLMILLASVLGMALIFGILIGGNLGFVLGIFLGGFLIYDKILLGLKGTWIPIFER